MSNPKSRRFSSLTVKSLDRLMPTSIKELIRAATDVLGFVSLLLQKVQQSKGLYEVLRYDATIELCDTGGQRAIYRKQEKVRFLQDCKTLYDYGWGDGQPYASHRVYPGRVVERQSVGPRFRSLIALPSPKRKGDTLTFTVRRRMDGAFITPDEWWLEAEVDHPIDILCLALVFPASRLARRAWVTAHRRQTHTELRLNRRLADGRQQVRYTMNSPDIGERYTLAWEW